MSILPAGANSIGGALKLFGFVVASMLVYGAVNAATGGRLPRLGG